MAADCGRNWVNVTGYPLSICDEAGNVTMELGEAATVVSLVYDDDEILRVSRNVPIVSPYSVVGWRCLLRGSPVPLASVAPAGSYLVCDPNVGQRLARLPYTECPFGILIPNTMSSSPSLRSHRGRTAYGAHTFVRSLIQLRSADEGMDEDAAASLLITGEVVAVTSPQRSTTMTNSSSGVIPGHVFDTQMFSNTSSPRTVPTATTTPQVPFASRDIPDAWKNGDLFM